MRGRRELRELLLNCLCREREKMKIWMVVEWFIDKHVVSFSQYQLYPSLGSLFIKLFTCLQLFLDNYL
jgi:hypothetical protein